MKKAGTKEVFQKNWWKLIVYMIIAYVTLIPIIIISMILVIVLRFVGMAIYFILLLAWMVYFIMGMNIVIIEDNFGTALGNIFRVGSRYIFKFLGMLVLVYLPTIILSVSSSLVMSSKIVYQYADNIDHVVEAMRHLCRLSLFLC